MILQQYYLGCLSHASYLVADEESKVAAIVDPQRDVDQYLSDAKAKGLTIRYVLLTHFHADFAAGHLELREATGAEIAMGRAGKAEFPVRGLADGDELALGRVRIRALETPGHTPESLCFLVFDDSKDATKPAAVLTGDTLFVGDVGRPDLLVATGRSADELARDLYHSTRKKLLPLPDETLVYPAHGAGSMCGKNLGSETFSTIGAQRKLNLALQPMDERAFVEMVTHDQPEAPGYFAFDAGFNKTSHSTLPAVLERALAPRTLDEALQLAAQGAILLDVRNAPEFAACHLAGSINVALTGKFATWSGSVVRPEEPVLLIADPGKEREAATRLARIGYDRIVGFLAGGPTKALESRPDLKRSSRRLAVGELKSELAAPSAPVVVDVRAAGERASGHIAGSLHVPLHRLRERMSEIPRDRPVVLQCAGGVRSMIAMSLLERAGYSNVRDLIGGYAAWHAAANPFGGAP